MKHFVMLVGLLVFVVGCRVGAGVGGGEETAVPLDSLTIDEATGLPINPPDVIDGAFILEGEVVAATLIPQDKPLFKVRTSGGDNFQISVQPVSDILLADGTELTALDLRNGITVRATVMQAEDVGLGGEPVLTSDDFMVLMLVE